MKTYSLEEMHKFYKDNFINDNNNSNDSNTFLQQRKQSARIYSNTTPKNLNINQSIQKTKLTKGSTQFASIKRGNSNNQIESNSFEYLLQKTLLRKESDVKFKKTNGQGNSHFVDLINYFNKDECQLGNILSLLNDIYLENKSSKEINYYMLLINCLKINTINRINCSHLSSTNQAEEKYLILIESNYLHMNECMNDMIEFTETMCCENADEGIIGTVSSRKIEEVMMNYDKSPEYKTNESGEPNEQIEKNPKTKKVIFSGIAMKIKPEKYQNGLFIIHEKDINLNEYICEFIPVNNSISSSSFTFSLNEIKLFLPFRFLYQYKAIHLFFFNRSGSKVIQFEDKEAFSFIFNFFTANCTKADKSYHEIKHHTNMWVDGILPNYDYLMYLNYLSGRSFCDLSQYPIFPWTYVNFKDNTVDLNNPQNFRDLSLPIGVVNPSRLEKCKERYNEDKYFFRNYISFPFVVYFYLMRTHPLFFLRHQGGSFNPPDRTFFSLDNCWNATYSKLGLDLKELIPEFYNSNGEFLKNIMNISFGTTQNGIQVNDVTLPPWAKSPMDFVQIMRSALESEIVSNSLHLWIDLVFGYKAKGNEAVTAHNLYHYLRYEECSDEIQEIAEEDRQSFLDEIIECGQVPIQLFSYPHPKKRSHFPLNELTDIKLLGDSSLIGLEIYKQKRIRAILEKKYEKERREKNVQTDQIRNIIKEKEESYNQQIKDLNDKANTKQIEFKAYVSSLKKMNQHYREMFGLYQENKEKLINEWIDKTNEEHKKKIAKQFENNKEFYSYLMNLENQSKKYENRKKEFEAIEQDLETANQELVNENKLMIQEKHEKSKLIRSYPVDIQIHLNK